MKHFAKTKRQFNYLTKQINKLVLSKKWATLSHTKKQTLTQRINILYRKVKHLIPTYKMVKSLGAVAFLIGNISYAQAQTFGSPQTDPFSIVDSSAFVMNHFIDIDNDGDLDMF